MVDQVELVERVARAISIPEHHTTWDMLTEPDRDLYRTQASHALEASHHAELVEALDYLVNAGLKLTDEGRNRADAVLAKVRTPTTPERSDD